MTDDNVTRIHPAPSIANPLHNNPWAALSDADIHEGIVRSAARIDAAQHTQASLRRELERRSRAGEPRYDVERGTWDKTCPCIRAEQVDPECPWHGRPEFRSDPEVKPTSTSNQEDS